MLEQLAPEGTHPEVAIGIPKIVITAKNLTAKAKYAEYVHYGGPLTLKAAIREGFLAQEEAERLIRSWEEDTGHKWLREEGGA